MATVVLAVALTAIGLALIYVPADTAIELVRELALPRAVETEVVALVAERFVAYLCLAASPLLLIAGSLLPGL